MNEVKTGRAGELIAAGVIEGLGCRSVLCQQENFDMLIVRGDKFYRCEVKTSKKPVPHRAHHRYEFNTSTGSRSKAPINADHVDIICLVALDTRKCYFINAKKHRVTRANVNAAKMAENDERVQFDQILAQIDGAKNGLE
jgi:hypothetical protein